MGEVITAINAKPETVENCLGIHEYVIPDYQRPYSWGKDECTRLWEDLFSYYENTPKSNSSISPYFLGNIVIYNISNKRHVIDGQQRIISLHLLIKALLCKCNSFGILERILYKVHPIQGNVLHPYETKIEHNVLGENENVKLIDALTSQTMESKYIENYNLFVAKIENHFIQNNNSHNIESFGLCLIKNVVLLPIECTDFDSALTIFETINNRGMDLSDTDIFKSKLYKFSEDSNREFVLRWNDLVYNANVANIDLKSIFSNYMHVLRGKEKCIDSIVGLRKFYDENYGARLKNWTNVLDSLEKLVWAWKYISDNDSNATVSVLNWSNVLSKYPNSYWEYPIMVFIHKNTQITSTGFLFTKNDELLELMRYTALYCYWKWIKYRGVNSIKDTIFKVVREISNNGDYKQIYVSDIKSDIANSNAKAFSTELNSVLQRDLGKGLMGICLLYSVINDKQTRLIPKEIQLEYILPQNWEKYDYQFWNKSSEQQLFEKLGNIAVIEKSLTIKYNNRHFANKKTFYGQSMINDLRLLTKYSNWTPDLCKERNKKIIERLSDFFVSILQ